ncbi:MAG: acyl-[Bacteroidaceae bacterium]|nr:acyl-[acyl-carrier-protein]--UDP-N-acetylglucosamine O-acyltransferase [Bacteroidaceae bacterium]
FAILSACVLVHQFSNIGSYVMIQGGSRINKDIPPYIIVGREPAKYCGLNIVGLRRRGFSNETITAIRNAYRNIYESGTIVSKAVEKIKEEANMTPEVEYIVNFIEKISERGIIG